MPQTVPSCRTDIKCPNKLLKVNELDDILLLRYLQGECNREDFEKIDTWLELSKENRKKLFDLETAYKIPLRERYSSQESLANAWSGIIKRINASEKIKTAAKRRSRIIKTISWSSAAAMAGIAVLIYFNRPVEEKLITVAVAANGEVRELVMPDGTKIWLNKASTLKYPESFSPANRHVSLDGEAYFEVTKNRESPFTVKSRTMHVTVLGTTFNINDNAGASTAEATLIEGEIEVKGNNNEGHVFLSPGQRAEMDLSARRMSIKLVNAKLDAVWHNNLIPFNDTPLHEIAHTLELLYGVDITLVPGPYDNKRYTGFIRHKDSISDVLGSLCNSIPMTYFINGKNITIKPSGKFIRQEE